jgi:drug/metabolite transporter (DMT)-like permease
MRPWRLAILLCCFCSSTAVAQQLPPTLLPISPTLRKQMWARGALGLAESTLLAGLGAALGGALMAGCDPEHAGDQIDTSLCDRGHASPAEGAALGAVVSYVLLAPSISGYMLAEPADKVGRRGSRSAAIVASYAGFYGIGGLSLATFHAIDDKPARVVAPVTTLLVLATLAAPLGLGYLAYRSTERRATPSLPGARAYLAPLVGKSELGLGFGARF